ncbi:MAG: potassium channel family protein [Geminicoccaceae bacterium]
MTVPDPAGTDLGDAPTPFSLRGYLRELYFGSERHATRFQLVLLTFDLITVTFFLVTTFLPDSPWIFAVDMVIALGLALDFAARLYISPRPLQYLMQPLAIIDLVVLASLLLPALAPNLGFLRLLRAVRLVRSYNVLLLVEREVPFARRNRRVMRASVNLVVFVFVVSAIVFVQQRTINPDISDYLDALYFTIATLTTTGFGDITLEGRYGRLLATLVMIVGISLFLNLVGAVFRPRKVDFPCPDCALLEHDVDAVFCKACGHKLKIPNEG